MTDLLGAAGRRTSRSETAGAGPAVSAERRLGPLLAAAAGGLASSGAVLGLLVAAALAGWFGADAGRYGDTRDAMLVGTHAWLLAHGAGLRLGEVDITAIPLGLTLLSALVTYRVGRRIGTSAAFPSAASTLVAAAVLAVAYAAVALVAALLAAAPTAEPGLARAGTGSVLLALVSGGAGLAVGSGHVGGALRRLPALARAALMGAAASVLLLVAASSFLLFGALVADFGTAATVLSRLHVDGSAGLMFTLVGIAFVPNAAALAAAYLIGPGFALGTGTVVSTTAVFLGPLPAFPLLAAVPDDGPVPGWAPWLAVVPAVLTAVGVFLAARAVPIDRIDRAAAAGLLAGLLCAVVLTGVVALAGGSVGPGRMADVGAVPADVLVAAAASCGGGGLLGGAAAGWRRRTSSRGAGSGSVA